jgi:hypothetical protein
LGLRPVRAPRTGEEKAPRSRAVLACNRTLRSRAIRLFRTHLAYQ